MKKSFYGPLCMAVAMAAPIAVQAAPFASDIPAARATALKSPTEGVITHEFVAEEQMKQDLMQMLADFSRYMTDNVQTIDDKNSEGDAMISFKGENTLGNNEQGVRHNADMSMICAFLAKYAKDDVKLPSGITWQQIEDLAMKSLVYSYSTHKANKLYACKSNSYWGSTSKSDNQWESSLWAMSVAYSAFFQWDKLTQKQKEHIQALLEAECQYELERSIPTGYAGDTKAEENGWEADILAATLGMFPYHEKAPKWFDRLREFAINSYSHPSDADNNTVIDPSYDSKTVADLYLGPNLYDDYTLQNHNLFHTSYQNVVMQELGEAALALKLFQTGIYGTEKWSTNALMHNNQAVMDNVLNHLALADGELAMPNGNDWSLFLFDQITSYSTMACFLKDPNALFLENMAYKYIKARQTTTSDGSWLLRADVGGRRMGVEGHRVMMSCLMHMVMPTNDITPTTWPEFNEQYGYTKVFPCQNVIRSSSKDRFSTFSWSSGLKSYTGYIASQNPDNNKIIVPYRANNTGNFLGWYNVSGKSNDATPVVSGIYKTSGKDYVMNGELNVNGASLNNRFAIYSTPGNAVIYLDYVKALTDATITREAGGMMAISVDEFTKTSRTFFSDQNPEGITLDGVTLESFSSDWANIDDELGFVTIGSKTMAFGERANNNSIMTAKFIPLYNAQQRSVKAGEALGARAVVYYTSVDAATTRAMKDRLKNITSGNGWAGLIAPDPDGTYYLLLSNFSSIEPFIFTSAPLPDGLPVLSVPTELNGTSCSASIIEQQNNSHIDAFRTFVAGSGLTAIQEEGDPETIYIRNNAAQSASPVVTFITADGRVSGNVDIAPSTTLKVSHSDGKISYEKAEMPSSNDNSPADGYIDITSSVLTNASFEDDKTYGTIGSAKLGSTTYDRCFINDVASIDPDVPNILPVAGWTNGTSMQSSDGNRPYRRLYSMPYSTELQCVSEAGNYVASCSPLVGDTGTGERCLTVLNSWAKGTNAISQTLYLPADEYRVLINVKYECPNQTSNDGSTIATSANTNSSLIGVKYGSVEDYRYPATASAWETLAFDVILDGSTPLTISLGYSSSAEAGAANQTLLYIDNVRILSKTGASLSLPSVGDSITDSMIYTISGIAVGNDATVLPKGIYIQAGRKIIVK